MARKRTNVDMYGKSWSPIDIPNLERAIQLYERLNQLQNNFANSLSGSSRIWGQINEQADLQNELQKIGIKASKDQCEEILKALQSQQKFNQVQEKTNQLLSASDALGVATRNYNDNKFSSSKFISQAQQRNANKVEVETFKELAKSFKASGKDINSQAFTDQFNKNVTTKLEKSSGKYDTASALMKVAADTFKKAVDTFSGLFFGGLRKQADVYEQTFTNISVRTGTTRGAYLSNQTGSASTLYSRGLAGNIANSEIQTMWNKLADIGMNQEKMFSRALDNVLTNKIVPYLDTSSQAVNILSERVDGRFVKDIRGINRLNQDIAGNNYTTQEMLQTLIDEMQPMSDAAIEQLAQGSAEVTAMINKLTPVMGAEAAKSYATQLFKTQKYSDQIIRGGNLTEKLSLINAMNGGVNIYDPTQFNDYIAMAGNVTGFINSLGPGYGSTSSGMIQNIIGGATGETYARMMGYANLINSGQTYDTLKNLTDLTPEAIAQASNSATSDYTNNVNNTLKQIQSNELENVSTWLAAIYEQIGYWGDILAVLVKGIAGVVGAKIIGGIGKKLLGIGGRRTVVLT